jgi:rhodanese-related sulfurtransferase
VKENGTKSRFFSRANGMKILKEALMVAVVGTFIGLIANYFSPKGLGLKQNYFPTPRTDSNPGIITTNHSGAQASQPNVGTNTNLPSESSAAERLRQNGLKMVDAAQTWQLFNDPRYAQHQVVFIDARDDKHYAEGHIPGAYQFDHYHPEKYLESIFPICQSAEQVVVYCTGGECEDSEYAAMMLRDAGLPNQKLFVYSGGITEWTAKHFPLETGAQPAGGPQSVSGK